MSSPKINSIKEVVREFTEADDAIKTVFPKVEPILVVRLIFDEKANKEYIYTLETNISILEPIIIN